MWTFEFVVESDKAGMTRIDITIPTKKDAFYAYEQLSKVLRKKQHTYWNIGVPKTITCVRWYINA